MASRAVTVVKLAQAAIEAAAPAAEQYRFMHDELWGRDPGLHVQIGQRAAGNQRSAVSINYIRFGRELMAES